MLISAVQLFHTPSGLPDISWEKSQTMSEKSQTGWKKAKFLYELEIQNFLLVIGHFRRISCNITSVATSPVALRWLCDSPRTGCARRMKNIYAWREQAIVREIATHDLYCCLLLRRESLRTCRSGFPIATKWCCDQDVEVVPSSAFTQRTCDRCGSL